MKKTLLLICSIIFISMIVSCEKSKFKEPDQIGKYAFDILKSMQDITKEDYINHFVSVEDLREYVKRNEDKIEDKIKNKMTSLTKEEVASEIGEDFNRLKKKAIESGIIWKDIEYQDYTYKLEKEGSLEGTIGDLYFKYNAETYRVKISTILLEHGYALVEVKRLKKN